LRCALEARARQLGFHLFGVAPPQAAPDDAVRLREWLERGYAAGMGHYLGRDVDERLDATRVLPGARSVVVVGLDYAQSPCDPGRLSGRPEGRIARFAQGRDYHAVLGGRIEALGRWLADWPEWPNEWGDPVWRGQVDAGPLLERAFARLAGLGFIGRNRCLIHPERGSWLLLGVLVSNAPLAADSPIEGRCGACRRCVEACPMGALDAPEGLDARRCLSYRTIETRDPVAPDEARRMGDRLFGCDTCQEVCPFNAGRESEADVDPDLRPGACSGWAPKGGVSHELGEQAGCPERIDGANATLAAILSVESNREFERRFAGSSLLRARRKGLVRNARIVARNLGRLDLMENGSETSADAE
jgi:epoxyqueuosine reductase